MRVEISVRRRGPRAADKARPGTGNQSASKRRIACDSPRVFVMSSGQKDSNFCERFPVKNLTPKLRQERHVYSDPPPGFRRKHGAKRFMTWRTRPCASPGREFRGWLSFAR